MFTAWPPTLGDLKSDVSAKDDRDDATLTANLAAAVAFVQRVHRDRYNFTEDPESELPAPDPADDADLFLGTVRLAARWQHRRRSPDAMIQAGDLGASRVSSSDPDIDRMLRIGRYAPPVFA